MVLVDVDITQGDNDGHAYRYGYSINATGFTITGEYLDNADPNTITANTSQSRIISGTNNKTQKTDSRGYFLFKGITIPIGSTIDDATLNLIGQSSAGGDVRVYGRLTASPTVPTSNGTSLFTKPLGTAFGTTTFASGTDAPVAIDMKSTIQELVNTFDYNNDNMMLIMKANSNTLPTTPISTGVSNSISVRPFEFGGAIPNLTINYTTGPTAPFTIDAILRPIPFDFTINALLLGNVTIIRPISDISTGSWTDTRLGNQDTELWDELDEVTPDDNTTAVTATGGTLFEVKLESVPDPFFHFGHKVFVRAKVENSNGSSRNIVIQLFQGATLIASENQPALTDSYVTYSMELTETQAGNITDYSDLRVRISET